MNETPLLQCRGLVVRFGGVNALSEVDFSAPKGEISALIGPNGAGKTTLLNAVSGLGPLMAGRITLGERDITAAPPHLRAKLGIVRTFQNLEIFSNMTVLENVMTGAHRRIRYSILDALTKSPRYRKGERVCREAARAMLDFVGLPGCENLPATDLAFGNQRLLELARALAAEPVLLLLDEPAAGLNMKETRTLGKLIRRIRDELHITIALVEHDMDLVMSISDSITVLQFGQLLAKGTPKEVQRNPEVVAAYLGSDDEPLVPAAEQGAARRTGAVS